MSRSRIRRTGTSGSGRSELALASQTIDKRGANLAALESINAGREQPIKVRQAKYLNTLVEQDLRAMKRLTRPMMGFKDFRCACILLGGIELMNMIAKGQMQTEGLLLTPADQFYSLVK